MRITLALAVALILSGCGDPPPSAYPESTSAPQDSALAPGDVIEVRIFYGAKEIVRSYRIGTHGTIAVPYIGAVQASGRPQAQIEGDIQTRLADGYLRDPIVSIYVKEFNSKKIAVIGQVRSPGTLTFFEGMTILEAISQAGGFTPMARSNAVTVTRTQGGKKVKFTVPVGSIAENKARNFTMRPGDAIFVPERLF